MNSLPSISVIVPVYNGGETLHKCLAALRASDLSAHEIIVVDDCSNDDALVKAQTSALIKQKPDREKGLEEEARPPFLSPTTYLRFFRLASRSGPAAARNAGANRALGDVLLFVDADVAVQRDTLSRVAELFRAQPTISAVFGSYDLTPAEPGFVSQYKNLLHHFVHQQSSAEAGTFWAGCGAIRGEAFKASGGFAASRFTRPSIEDIELGYRLRGQGFRIVLDKQLQVKHLKRWTLGSLLRADIFSRAVPWSRLILERGEIINDLNLRLRERVCAALVMSAIAMALLSSFSPLFLAGTILALASVFFINLSLFRFFWTQRGLTFTAKSFAMQTLYYSYSSAVFSFCYLQHVIGRAAEFIRPRRTATETGLVRDA